MTKSQNTKNEQQKDLCITSEQLTEQMHKGKLPEGWYYVIKTGDVEMLEYSCNYFLAGDVPLTDNEVTEVLAPVPTFDELQNMNKAVNECMAANIKLVEQNKQLKEQINKCCLDAINRGTANTVKAVKEFGMPERIEELVKQNAQLKELLKECRTPLSVYNEMFGNKEDLLQHIDEVLK